MEREMVRAMNSKVSYEYIAAVRTVLRMLKGRGQSCMKTGFLQKADQ